MRHTVSDHVLKAIEEFVASDVPNEMDEPYHALLNDPAKELWMLRTLVLYGISIADQVKVRGQQSARNLSPNPHHTTPPLLS